MPLIFPQQMGSVIDNVTVGEAEIVQKLTGMVHINAELKYWVNIFLLL